MKQILQSFKSGKTTLEELPTPSIGEGSILIQTTCSLVSLGTERMLVEFGKASLIEKTRQQPEKVKQVLDKIKVEGFLPTMEVVFNKLGQPIPLGYCNVGRVIGVGDNISEFSIGDRVTSNGPHAEVVSVPKNLVAKIPESVSDEEAVFTVIGSIALQGIRLMNPQLGETIVVFGLGLIGLIGCQLLKANGCNVIGIDLDQSKCDLASKWGVKTFNPMTNDPVKSVMNITNAHGADGVLITASTKTDEVISQAAQMSRKQGRIVLVGVVGLNINRSDFYEKELTFQVSCSYGPGRYDSQYEEKGIDYPFPYVRWTEKRNFETILQLIHCGTLNVNSMISEKVELKNYDQIYDDINSKKSIASILKYDINNNFDYKSKILTLKEPLCENGKGVIGLIGAGNFTNSTLLPNLVKNGEKVEMIASLGGLSGTILSKKYGISQSTSNYKDIINDKLIDTIFITTRHNTHAKMVVESLKAGKNVFVEKPLALNISELNKIIDLYIQPIETQLLVGFNRRFSPHIEKIKKSLGSSYGAVNISMTMNAGYIPTDHWVHDSILGGGRIIGEACHLIDLCLHLSGSRINSVCANSLGINTDLNSDNLSILLKFDNGSNAVINYFSNGSKKYSKERFELYSDEKIWVMDNYRKTIAYGVKNFRNFKSKIDKGHKVLFNRFIDNIRNGDKQLIPINELINVTKASFAVIDSLKLKKWIKVDDT